MPNALDRLPSVGAPDRAAWRAWLRRHHRTASGVWLVYQKKHSATPRKPRSTWSPSNKRRVQELIAGRRMTRVGLAKIAAAKADGSWESLDTVETLTVPAELRRALAAEGDALRNFRGYAASIRKAMLYWLSSAKRPATRERRLAKLVAHSAAHTSGREFRP